MSPPAVASKSLFSLRARATASKPAGLAQLLQDISCENPDGLTAGVAAATRATYIVRDLAVAEEQCKQMVKAGGVPVLVDACKPLYPSGRLRPLAQREQAARALGHVAAHGLYEELLLQCGTVPALCTLLAPPPDGEGGGREGGSAFTWLVEAADGEARMARVWLVEAALEALASLSDCPQTLVDFEAARGEELLLRLLPGAPERCRKPAGRLLVDVFMKRHCTDGAKPSALRPAVIDAFLGHATLEDTECQEEGVWAISHLASDPANAAAILASGAPPMLLQLAVASPHAAVALQATWALANLSVDCECKEAMVYLDTVPQLMEVLQAQQPVTPAEPQPQPTKKQRKQQEQQLLLQVQQQQQLLRCLSNLLTLPECREQLATCEGGLAALLRHAQPLSPPCGAGPSEDEMRLVACRVLANVTIDAPLARQAVREGALPTLAAMLGSRCAALEAEALSTLLNIAAAAEAGGAADGAGSDDDEAYEPGPAAREVLEPLVAGLVAMLDASRPDAVQRMAALALAHVAKDDKRVKLRLVELGTLTVLGNLLSDAPSAADVQEALLGLMRLLSEVLTPCSRRTVMGSVVQAPAPASPRSPAGALLSRRRSKASPDRSPLIRVGSPLVRHIRSGTPLDAARRVESAPLARKLVLPTSPVASSRRTIGFVRPAHMPSPAQNWGTCIIDETAVASRLAGARGDDFLFAAA